MQIEHREHVPGKGSYVVVCRFGPRVAVEVFGPDTYTACERYIERKSITEVRA